MLTRVLLGTGRTAVVPHRFGVAVASSIEQRGSHAVPWSFAWLGSRQAKPTPGRAVVTLRACRARRPCAGGCADVLQYRPVVVARRDAAPGLSIGSAPRRLRHAV